MKQQGNILIVDDNINLSRTLSFVLQETGYKVETVSSGEDAITAVKRNSFDIIFMDIKMPRMNGVEAFKQIKAIDPTTAVVIMTAFTANSLVREALSEGAYSVLYKPLDITQLLELIPRIKENNQKNILLVDDDETYNISLQNILTDNGYNVDICQTGKEAIELASHTDFDIIFLDIKLPDMNGLETCLGIKEVNNNALIIMMTGYRQEFSHLIDELLDNNNAHTCLFKPLEINNLLEMVNGLIR